jgi:hypothetical protein
MIKHKLTSNLSSQSEGRMLKRFPRTLLLTIYFLRLLGLYTRRLPPKWMDYTYRTHYFTGVSFPNCFFLLHGKDTTMDPINGGPSPTTKGLLLTPKFSEVNSISRYLIRNMAINFPILGINGDLYPSNKIFSIDQSDLTLYITVSKRRIPFLRMLKPIIGNPKIITKTSKAGQPTEARTYQSSSSGSFLSHKVRPDERVEITSSYGDLFVGKLKRTSTPPSTRKPKLVLQFFIDGLFDYGALQLEKSLDHYMPETMSYFQSGIMYRNHWATSEWTMPSVASMYTGSLLQSHLMIHRSRRYHVPNSLILINEVFQNSNWNVFNYQFNGRKNPFYGYSRGVDYLVYMRDQLSGAVVNNVISDLDVISSHNAYVHLDLLDLHELPKPDTTKFVGREKVETSTSSTLWERKQPLVSMYELAMGQVDQSIRKLLTTLHNTYDDGDLLVVLCSDHGKWFLNPHGGEKGDLSLYSTRVPFMMRGMELKARTIESVTSNLQIGNEIFSSIPQDLIESNSAKQFASQFPHKLFSTHSDLGQFACVQSVYPGKTYKLRVITDAWEACLESTFNVNPSGFLNSTEIASLAINELSSGMDLDDPSARASTINIYQYLISELNPR